ncbi:MAG: flavodoxin family protein [Planctomycetota bacterium]|jgi:multimeric flavodoxin WrbA
MDRRNFISKSLVAGAAATVASQAHGSAQSGSLRIVGISCSPRKGKTTATAVGAALDAARTVDARIKTELIDLGGMEIAGFSGAAKPTEDDFNSVVPMLTDPVPDGLIIGSPSYFRSMSALCKAFLERLAVLRKPKLMLADVPAGVLSVGAYRNGGQELVIEQVQSVLLCHEVMIVGGKPGAHQGATLWNFAKDDIAKDEFGMDTARKLGIRVAEAAVSLASR